MAAASATRKLYEKGRVSVTLESVSSGPLMVDISTIASASEERPTWSSWVSRGFLLVALFALIEGAYSGNFWKGAAVFGQIGSGAVLFSVARTVRVSMKDGKVVNVGNFGDDTKAIVAAIRAAMAESKRSTELKKG